MRSKSISKKKKNSDPRSFLERFLTTRILAMLGLFFLTIGLVFSLSSTDGSNRLLDAILLLFKSSGGETKYISSWDGFTKILMFSLPAFVILIISIIYAPKYSYLSYPISLFVTLYLIVLQVYLVINYLFISGWYYPNVIVALIFLIIGSGILLFSIYKHQKNVLIFIAVLYIYISIITNAFVFSTEFDYLFVFSILLSIVFVWLNSKIKYNYINILNYLFYIFFFSLFIVRKFIVNTKPENIIVFFVFSALFYILYYLIIIYLSNSKEKALGPKNQALMIWSNLIFYLLSSSFVLIKFYSFNYIWALVLALLVFNLIGLLFINKYKLSTYLFPYYSIIILLASLVLPLLIQQNILFLFSLIFGVFMLFYANIKQNKFAFWLSISALVLSFILFFKLWLSIYLLSMFALGVSPDLNMLWTGIVNGLLVVISLGIIKTKIKDITHYINYKWFTPFFKQIIYSLYQTTIFLTLGWMFFTLTYLISASVNLSSQVWMISGCLYFLFYIRQFAGKSSPHKKGAHYMAFGFVLIYPLLLGLTILQRNLIVSGELNTFAVILHYIALVLLLILATMSAKRIYKRNAKFLLIQNGVQLLIFIYLAYFVCTELDTLTLVLNSLMYSSAPDFILHFGLIEFNIYLPYSVVLWVLSVAVFMFGVFYHKPFLRMLALYLFLIILIKLFLFDFEMISTQARSAVFYGLGIFLICFALLYPKIKAANARSKSKYSSNLEE